MSETTPASAGLPARDEPGRAARTRCRAGPLALLSALLVATIAWLVEARLEVASLEQELAGERQAGRDRDGRLRGEILERERRLGELVQTLDGLRTRQQAVSARLEERPAPAGQALAPAVNAALSASGVTGLKVVEVGALSDGALVDLLLARDDGTGTGPRAERVPRAALFLEAHTLGLRLVRDASVPGSVEDVLMPRADRAAWEAAGLSLPSGFVTLPEVEQALSELLAPHDLRLLSLGGLRDGVLYDLELEQLDGQGRPDGLLRAARARVLPGPELLMEDGSVTRHGRERSFWQDRNLVPLPGASAVAWQRLLGGGG